jgi:AAHS family 4-hydroxybenzoate transporter-like MFS transporter
MGIAYVRASLGIDYKLFYRSAWVGWIALAPLLGVPFVLLIGTGIDVGGLDFVPALVGAQMMIGAGHAAVISITSVYYPSTVRATGGGWASFIAKFAAVTAPIFGARFLAGREAAMSGYMFNAMCLCGIVVGVLLLAYFARSLHSGASGRID